MATSISLKRNDTLQSFQIQLVSRRTGQPIDLTDASRIEFRMYTDAAPRVRKVFGSAGIVGVATNGTVKYIWQPGDTDAVGDYLGEVRVLYDDGDGEAMPEQKFLRIHIDADLDNA